MKLLIIEDSERLRRTLTIGLENSGFMVESTGDGLMGLKLAQTYDFDLILLDIMLPSLDGFAFLKHFRESKKNTNILILSAKDETHDRIKGLNLGADDYLCKPFDFDELLARIHSIIRRSLHTKSACIELGKVILHLDLHKVFVADTALLLTPYEYKIFERLALNRGRVCSIDTLLNYLYEVNSNVAKNTIEVHISSLRKKLAAAGIVDLIKNQRGFGYCIDKVHSEN
jgi:DNA-binding response OmpR family regulator